MPRRSKTTKPSKRQVRATRTVKASKAKPGKGKPRKAKAAAVKMGKTKGVVAQRRIVTPSQTVGPYLRLGFGQIPALTRADIPGDRIAIAGRMTDGNGDPVPDGMIETWQANARGKYDHPEDWQDKQTTPGFHGFGRWVTAKDGTFRIETIRPGAVPYPGRDPDRRNGKAQAPHLVVTVFARGLLKHLFTRVYFQGDPALAEDPVLHLVKDPARRETLIAKPDPTQPGLYRWDLRLQGAGETVFFDV